MNLAIQDIQPDPALSSCIERYWTGTFNVSGEKEWETNIIPNGCIEVIMHTSDDHCLLTREGHQYTKSPTFTLLGVYSKPYIVKFPAPVKVMGIRFFPDGFNKIFGIPPGTFFSTYEDGYDVIGENIRSLHGQIRETSSLPEKISFTNRFFMDLLRRNSFNPDRIQLTMRLIREKNGDIHFDEIKETIPLSLRQLQRGFKIQYGITITDYIRLIRLNAINKYLLSNPHKLTELAYKLNFTDQSHFIREFKHYTGVSPRKFLKNLEAFIVNAV